MVDPALKQQSVSADKGAPALKQRSVSTDKGAPSPKQRSVSANEVAQAPLWRRLAWMAAIWATSVTALGAVGYVLRLWLAP